jgi:hypothetical protein
MAHLFDVIRMLLKFSKFDRGPEIGDAQAADGAMTPQGKKSFSDLRNMHIFGKPYISGILKYIN